LTPADEFQYLIVLGWSAAAALRLDEPLRELVNLHSKALSSGANDTHLRRAWSIINRIAASADDLDKPAPRGRGRPRQLEPSEKDVPILGDIRRLVLELKHAAIVNEQELDPRRVRQIERAAIRAAIDASENQGDLNEDTYPRADEVRLDRWRKRELEQLKQLLAEAIARAPRSQNGT
jgi:hypothetical protein